MRKDNIESYVNKCIKKFPNLDYSNIQFINSTSPVTGILCHCKDENGNEHGELKITNAATFLRSNGCSKCYLESKNAIIQKQKQQKFIETAIKIFGNDKFDLSKVVYKNERTPVKIICKKCGYEFEQYPNNFLRPVFSCQRCKEIERTKKNIINLDDEDSLYQKQLNFIEEAKKLHVWQSWEDRDKNQYPDGTPKYDYSKVKYKNSRTPVIIICPLHGEFEQAPCNHNNNQNCPKCRGLKLNKFHSKTLEQFITTVNHLFPNNKYSFEKTKYVNNKTKVIITCHEKDKFGNEHGDFETRPDNLFNFKIGCTKCNGNHGISNEELDLLEYIKSIYSGKIIMNTKSILPDSYEIDIYLPDKRIGIEFNGLYWHSELQKSYDYHLHKTELAESKGIHLIQIYEDNWSEKRLIVKSRLQQILGVTERKIFARKCKIKVLNTFDEQEFMISNHLQEYIPSMVCYGLTYDNELVAAMSFGELRKNLGQQSEAGIFELYRFVTKKNTSVIGGASKLFKHFIKRFNPKKVISYADRCWSTNNESNLYRTLGFKFESYTAPNYYIIQNGVRRNRYNFRKDILVSKYGCPKEMSEHEFCMEIGLYRIYNSGNIKYIWMENPE